MIAAKGADRTTDIRHPLINFFQQAQEAIDLREYRICAYRQGFPVETLAFDFEDFDLARGRLKPPGGRPSTIFSKWPEDWCAFWRVGPESERFGCPSVGEFAFIDRPDAFPYAVPACRVTRVVDWWRTHVANPQLADRSGRRLAGTLEEFQKKLSDSIVIKLDRSPRTDSQISSVRFDYVFDSERLGCRIGLKTNGGDPADPPAKIVREVVLARGLESGAMQAAIMLEASGTDSDATLTFEKTCREDMRIHDAASRLLVGNYDFHERAWLFCLPRGTLDVSTHSGVVRSIRATRLDVTDELTGQWAALKKNKEVAPDPANREIRYCIPKTALNRPVFLPRDQRKRFLLDIEYRDGLPEMLIGKKALDVGFQETGEEPDFESMGHLSVSAVHDDGRKRYIDSIRLNHPYQGLALNYLDQNDPGRPPERRRVCVDRFGRAKMVSLDNNAPTGRSWSVFQFLDDNIQRVSRDEDMDLREQWGGAPNAGNFWGRIDKSLEKPVHWIKNPVDYLNNGLVVIRDDRLAGFLAEKIQTLRLRIYTNRVPYVFDPEGGEAKVKRWLDECLEDENRFARRWKAIASDCSAVHRLLILIRYGLEKGMSSADAFAEKLLSLDGRKYLRFFPPQALKQLIEALWKKNRIEIDARGKASFIVFTAGQTRVAEVNEGWTCREYGVQAAISGGDDEKLPAADADFDFQIDFDRPIDRIGSLIDRGDKKPVREMDVWAHWPGGDFVQGESYIWVDMDAGSEARQFPVVAGETFDRSGGLKAIRTGMRIEKQGAGYVPFLLYYEEPDAVQVRAWDKDVGAVVEMALTNSRLVVEPADGSAKNAAQLISHPEVYARWEQNADQAVIYPEKREIRGEPGANVQKEVYDSLCRAIERRCRQALSNDGRTRRALKDETALALFPEEAARSVEMKIGSGAPPKTTANLEFDICPALVREGRDSGIEAYWEIRLVRLTVDIPRNGNDFETVIPYHPARGDALCVKAAYNRRYLRSGNALLIARPAD